MKFLKSLLLDNLGTKLMALVLALLLWVYLYNESTESDEVDAAFEPRIEETSLASWQAIDSAGNPIAGQIRIRLTGPKGDLRVLSRKGLRCQPRFERGLFADDKQGSFTRDLSLDDFNLPETVKIGFKPSKRITIRYVKFRTARLRVVLPAPAWEGKPAADYKVVRVTLVDPPETDPFVQVQFPASLDLSELRLKPVFINGLSGSDDKVRGQPSIEDPSVRPLQSIRLEVVVKPDPQSVEINVPLFLAGDTAVTSRLELKTPTISVTVEGPKAEIEKIDRLNPGATFFAYAIAEITGSLPPVNEKGQILHSLIHCEFRDKRLHDKLTITVRDDQVADYRVIR